MAGGGNWQIWQGAWKEDITGGLILQIWLAEVEKEHMAGRLIL
jgi:hypothetical protein